MLQTQAQAAPPAPAPAPVSSAAAMEEDEELDPELAEALRMSMQQEEAGAASDAAVPTGAPAGDVCPSDWLLCTCVMTASVNLHAWPRGGMRSGPSGKPWKSYDEFACLVRTAVSSR